MDRRVEQRNKFVPRAMRVAAVGVFALGYVIADRVASAEALHSVSPVYSPDCRNEAPINLSIPDFNYCPRPNEALIHTTSVIYKESNDVKGYQKGHDKVTGLQVGATYLMRNTANHNESYEVIVNENGQLSRTIEVEGKKVEQVIFAFTADPNTTPHKAANGRSAVEVEFVRHGAYDITTKEYREGDPVRAYTALGCTALDFGIRLEERFLSPNEMPVPVEEAPATPVQLPPVQIPARAPAQVPGR